MIEKIEGKSGNPYNFEFLEKRNALEFRDMEKWDIAKDIPGIYLIVVSFNSMIKFYVGMSEKSVRTRLKDHFGDYKDDTPPNKIGCLIDHFNTAELEVVPLQFYVHYMPDIPEEKIRDAEGDILANYPGISPCNK